MYKSIKRLVSIILCTILSFIVSINVTRAACSISISAPNSVVVGNTFKVTSTVSQDAGAWTYVLSYDSSKVQLVSGNTKVVGVIGDSRSNSYTFKALSSGSASFKAVNADIALDSTKSKCSVSAGSATVTMRTQAEIEATYSKNNNLSSLSVEGATLSPEFNSNTLEYSATMPVDTTKVNVSATAQDKTATIEGIGEKDVVDGTNRIEVVVTAQHGEKKTYVINLTVEELDPITVKIGNKEYTVVRKKGQIEKIPTGFEESTVKISEQDIACYASKIAKLTLVGLKDSDGVIKLYIYDEKNNKYLEFNEVSNNSVNLLILTSDTKAPEGFKNTKLKYNDVEVDAYKFEDDTRDNYYLVYAQNLENGSKDFYLYDKREGTFQRFYDNLIDSNKDMISKLKNLIVILLGAIVFILIMLIISLIVSGKRKRKLRNNSDETYELSDLDSKPEIKQLDTTFEIPKKSKKQKLSEIKEAKERLEKSKPSYKNLFDEDE